MNYAYTKKLNYSFFEALDEVRFMFEDSGFGIVSNINVAERIRKSNNPDFLEYTILGVCDSRLAYAFLNEEMDLGVFMPCSIAIYEKTDGVYISAGLPDGMLPKTIKDNDLIKLGNDVTNNIKKIIDSL